MNGSRSSLTPGLNVRVGVIGTGAMGSAILRSILDSQILTNPTIWFYEISDDACKWLVEKGHKRCDSVSSLLSSVDVVLLCVKPQSLPSLIPDFSSFPWTSQHILVSILAGTSLATLQQATSSQSSPHPVRIVRAMPNLGASVSESITAIDGLDPSALDITEKLMGACGSVLRLPEKHFNLATAVSGSGPAYFFLLMEVLAKKAEEGGIPKEAAMKMAVHTALAAGKLVKSSTRTPEEWRKMVTSKGGTTEAALNVMHQKKWGDVIEQAVDAAKERGVQLNAKM